MVDQMFLDSRVNSNFKKISSNGFVHSRKV